MLQCRPGVPSVLDKFYSPQRDLANAGPHLVRLAAMSLDSIARHDPELSVWLAEQGVTEDQLGETAQRLARSLSLLRQQKHHHEALQAVGFNDMPWAARMALFAKMGQCLLAATWAGVKDVNVRGEGVPTDLANVVNFTEEVIAKHRATLQVPAAD